MIAMRLLLDDADALSAAGAGGYYGGDGDVAGDGRDSGDVGERALDGLLAGERVFLRGVEAGDLEFLYRWENNPAVWRYGDSKRTFTRDEIMQFIENQRHDVYITGQQRLVICRREDREGGEGLEGHEGRKGLEGCEGRDGHEGREAHGGHEGFATQDAAAAPVGFIDIFDFEPVERRAGVGILICDPAHRGKGYGAEALRLTIEYARGFLGLRELWCNVAPENAASLALFSAAAFERVGQLMQKWVE
jgi:diamine N-acetyltransferase